MRQTVITKCVRYYKAWQTLLQSASGITKCDSYYKVTRNNGFDKKPLTFISAYLYNRKKETNGFVYRLTSRRTTAADCFFSTVNRMKIKNLIRNHTISKYFLFYEKHTFDITTSSCST